MDTGNRLLTSSKLLQKEQENRQTGKNGKFMKYFNDFLNRQGKKSDRSDYVWLLLRSENLWLLVGSEKMYDFCQVLSRLGTS